MITVDCRDVEQIKHDLLVYVSDNVAAIPAVKLHEFVLSPIGEEDIDQSVVVAAIKEFLESIGEARNFAVVSAGESVSIRSVSGKQLDRNPAGRQPGSMFACPHCGFVTRYEVEYNQHKVIHYF